MPSSPSGFADSVEYQEGVLTKRTIALVVLLLGYIGGGSFTKYCWQLSESLSNPTIVQKARLRDGRVILLDDYRDAYNWLKDNTPEDSRVMAWWDYGYQIAGIANRTTIADGNTWNHEHIALLGKAFTTDLDTGYEISRHWADYVLIWGGGMGDDLGKSPHLARIANSGEF
jgi:dolichyl-diphosphooligosaccharide--protein glycosyltransferase